ncbi:betaine/proline/choline family ABC transporter ATP-binding protein [Xanthovirga aplysinae]|uniref:betaine/proline/choline family ABC transporter ATP-binding protein n=1 Tax=Xanthovirga aplysinae TaxID=2529853 RepID=UPI0012BD41A9|nr:betaine/proline/choline family ABC transporter ATP-binding protein [Xanthovirga aplysinae]MTI30402.1 ATP-binding cassette domain-containing protein [Xanthovirga aplysinae]
MIELKHVGKTFDGKKQVVDDLNLVIQKGEIVCLIGRSGCGKTTTLKMINLLQKPSTGEIRINGKNIQDKPEVELRRNIGYVFQKVGLFPHISVGKNIELVPYLKKWPQKKRKKRAEELLDMIGLPAKDYYHRLPNELSGGQQQRVGVARALAADPEIILMDEPFSAIDPISRKQLQEEILRIQEELHKTIVFVTHDMDEALKLADKIAIMKEGKILQYGTPDEILHLPKNEFVKRFIGQGQLWRNPENVLAKNLMSPTNELIPANLQISEALNLMEKENLNELFVYELKGEDKRKLMGQVKKEDLLQVQDSQLMVQDILSYPTQTVKENNNLLEILDIMANGNFQNLLVIDKEGNCKGQINQANLLKALADISPKS